MYKVYKTWFILFEKLKNYNNILYLSYNEISSFKKNNMTW